MECYEEKIKKDVFNYPTTYQNDFRKYCDYKKKNYRYEKARTEREVPTPSVPPLRDPQTFAEWRKDVKIPFDLLWEPKPILQPMPQSLTKDQVPKNCRKKYEHPKNKPRYRISYSNNNIVGHTIQIQGISFSNLIYRFR